MKSSPKNQPKSRNELADLSDEQHQAYVDERLSRFGDKAGKHGPLSAVAVMVPVRLSRDTGLQASTLARRLGLRRATWAAQGLAVLARCHPDDWFKAIAAFQAAQKNRASSEAVG